MTNEELQADYKDLTTQLEEALVLVERAKANANALSGAMQYIERKLNSSINGAVGKPAIQDKDE